MKNSEKIINEFHLIIFSNSPGEISSWVIPLAKSFKYIHPSCFISVLLTPCDYATGNEAQHLTEHDCIDEVYLPKQTMSFVFFKKKFNTDKTKGAILYLGGDPMYPQLLSLRLPFPVYGYTEHKKKLGFLYKKTFFKHIDGDLMSSSIAKRTFSRENILSKYHLKDAPYCLFMPGSRPKHFHLFIPLILESIRLIQNEDSSFQALISVSPFITDNDVTRISSKYDLSNVHLIRGDSLELMAISRLMISLPGTNTAQAMYMNLPTLMVLPLNNPEQFVFDGLFQLIFKLPLIGSFLRFLLIKILLIKKPFLALPNLIAKKEIVPELITYFTADTLKSAVLDLYNDQARLDSIISNYKGYNEFSDVDQKICDYIVK